MRQRTFTIDGELERMWDSFVKEQEPQPTLEAVALVALGDYLKAAENSKLTDTETHNG